MVEEYSGAGKQAVRFAVVGHFPESGGLCDRIGAPGTERRFFISGNPVSIPETFALTGIIKFDWKVCEPDGFQEVQSADTDALQRLHRLLEGKTY